MSDYRSIWTYLYKTPHRLDYIEVEGVRTRYLEAGPKEAPAVVMLHGMAGSLENFSANVAAYAEHFHVYAIDLMGCGWNDRPDYPYTSDVYVEHVRGFMDAVGVERASLVGVSLGSAVAAFLAHKHPSRVSSVVMVTPAGLRADVEEHIASVTKARQSRLDAVQDPSWENVHSVFKRLLLKEEDIIPDIVAVRLAIYSSPEMKTAMHHLVAVSEEKGLPNEEWRKITAPMLVIAAPDGQGAYYKNAKLIHSVVPNSRLVEIKDVDHWAHFEAADVFNPLSIAFIQEALGASAEQAA